MFKVTISGEVDEDEEYVKEMLQSLKLGEGKGIADIDDPMVIAEMLLAASNPRLVSVSVEKRFNY